MQTSSDKSQPKQDQNIGKGNEVDDSITIEYLRARLLSERSISKATKERADELAIRVRDLDEQLKVMTLQRKRAEKAARDIYSYLNSLGVSDVSDVYESDSDEGNSQCESNLNNNGAIKDDKALGPLEVRKDDDEQSGSEPDSIPSSGRSLSWKGRKEDTRSLNLEKKSLNCPIRSRTSLAEVNSLPRRRPGRSCRQFKKKEPRSTVDESRYEPCKSEAQDNAVNGLDHLGFQNENLKKSPEISSERGSEKEEVYHSFQVQECDASSSTHEYEFNGKIERALQHQAQLIRSYEAQEKAQRDWEEKYAENNDSCEPGSHSDVTEERDENKATVSHPIGVNTSHGHDQRTGTETDYLGRKPSIAHINSFKVSPDAGTVSSEKHTVNRDTQPPASHAPDFTFTVANNGNQSWNHARRSSAQHTGLVESPKIVKESHKEPARLGAVLDALQEAKLLIKQQMDCLPETSNRDVDWLKLPVACRGLFSVPTDYVDPTPSQTKPSISDYTSEVASTTMYGRTLAVQGHQYISNSSGDPSSTRDSSNWHSRSDFHFDTNISGSSKSNSNLSYPEFFPGPPSYQMMGQQTLGNGTAILPSGYHPF